MESIPNRQGDNNAGLRISEREPAVLRGAGRDSGGADRQEIHGRYAGALQKLRHIKCQLGKNWHHFKLHLAKMLRVCRRKESRIFAAGMRCIRAESRIPVLCVVHSPQSGDRIVINCRIPIPKADRVFLKIDGVMAGNNGLNCGGCSVDSGNDKKPKELLTLH